MRQLFAVFHASPVANWQFGVKIRFFAINLVQKFKVQWIAQEIHRKMEKA
jgi:hypothetical protein